MARKQKQRIQTLFLQPADSYTLREVATLTDTPVRSLRREVAHGDRDATKVRGAWRFTWRQAVYVAMARYTLTEIHDALGDAAAGALPPLLALRTVTLRLPAFIVCTLETIASGNGTTLDACLHQELMELAGVWAEEMEATHPGFRRAYLFPTPA